MPSKLEYIRTNSNIPSISKLFNKYMEGSTIVIDDYVSNTLYDSIKIPNYAFLCYSVYAKQLYYPPGVSINNNMFSFSIGKGDNEVSITVDLNDKEITLERISDGEKVTGIIDIEVTDPFLSTSGRLWCISVSVDNIYIVSQDTPLLKYSEGDIYLSSNPHIFGRDASYSFPSLVYPSSDYTYKESLEKGKRCRITSPHIKSNNSEGIYPESYFITNIWNGDDLSVDSVFWRTVGDYFPVSTKRVTDNLATNLSDVTETEDIPGGGDDGGDTSIPPIKPNKPDAPGNYPDDDTPEPELPDINITDGGFITIYRPSLSDLQDLATFMWSDAFSLTTFKKLLTDPMDAIIGLSILPFNTESAGYKSVKIGNIDSGLSFSWVASQWKKIDCGSVIVTPPWESYVDYNPHTKVSIYLPYIGINTLNADDIVGGELHVVYHIDILTGSLVCYLIVTKDGHERILYTYNGQCSISVPLTSVNYSSMMASVVGAAVTAVTGGTGGAIMAGTQLTSGALSDRLKPDIARSGSFSQSCGFLGVQYPYLIWERPVVAVPENYESMRGVGSQITATIAESKGYTVVDDINLSGLTATDDEKNEIIRLLKGGVIV